MSEEKELYLADATTTGVLLGIIACHQSGWNIDENLVNASEYILKKAVDGYLENTRFKKYMLGDESEIGESDKTTCQMLDMYKLLYLKAEKKSNPEGVMEKLDEVYSVYGMAEHYVVRKVMIANLISQLVEEKKIGAVINNGGGLDPSMLVLSAKHPDLKIIEIDREGTIKYKQSVVQEKEFLKLLNLKLDNDFEFIGADFSRESIKDLIEKSENLKDIRKPAFVNIEGVSMYLDVETNLQMLKHYKENLPVGSFISIGVLEQRYHDANFGTDSMSNLQASSVGLHSHFDYDSFAKLADQAGFDVVLYSGYEQIQIAAYGKDIKYQSMKILGERGGEAFYVLKSRGLNQEKTQEKPSGYVQIAEGAIANLTRERFH
jgi:O-methyltransferase involved in polyketide biosynthesis